MQVMVVHHTPTLTRQRYERVVRGLSGKDRLESPSDVPTPGLVVHVAAETDVRRLEREIPVVFMIFDVFESAEAFDQFRAVAGPIATEAGIEEPPKSFPLHTFIST